MRTDWELLEAAKGGDENAWRALAARYNPHLIKIASLITGSAYSAPDLAQETFIRLINIRIKHTSGSFKFYITRMVHNLALKAIKKRREFSIPDNLDPADNTPSVTEDILKAERNSLIFKTITSLDDSHRQTLILRFYGELSYEDIAKILKLPLGTVKSRIFYAVKACRQKMIEEGVLNETLR